MFGFGRKARLRREVEVLTLEKQARDLREALSISASAGTTATYPLSDPQAFEKLFGPASSALSAEKAMTHSAVYRCVFLIAGSISMIDLEILRRNADGHVERDDGNSIWPLLTERPNPRMSPSMMWRQVVSDMLLNGNGIVWIERAGPYSSAVKALWPIPWNRVGIRLDRIAGEAVQVYALSLDDGRVVAAHQDDVLHIPGSAQWQIFRAMSPLSAYAMAAGVGISADAFAKAYFDNSASPDGYLKFPQPLKGGGDHAEEVRASWVKRFGGASRFAGPAILDQGGEFVPLRINAADAQLLDSRKFQIEDVARIFGVPPHMVGALDKSTSWGKGIEEQTQGFLDYTLGPHLKAIEDEVQHKLVRSRDLRAVFDRDALIRADIKSRSEALQVSLGGAQGPGWRTPNEARFKEQLGRSKEPHADMLTQWAARGGASAAPQSAV